MRAAVEAGYGVVVTTGGVGAESKDHTIEALLKVDPQAATPYLTYFRRVIRATSKPESELVWATCMAGDRGLARTQ